MGQRLNIEIRDGDTTLANSYYHWSAYSGAALGLVGEIIQAYQSEKSVRMLDIAVNLLQATGAGVNEKERSRIASDTTGKFSGIQFKDASGRNEGLISVTNDGIEETRYWEEGRVTVDLASETFTFDVLFGWCAKDYMENYGHDEYNDLRINDFDFVAPIPFSDIFKIESIMKEYPNGYRLPCGDVICWIE